MIDGDDVPGAAVGGLLGLKLGAGASGRLAADVARRSKQLYAQESQSPQRRAMQAQLQQLADADAAGRDGVDARPAPVRPPSSGTTGDGAPLVRPGSAPFKLPVMEREREGGVSVRRELQ